MGQLVCGNNREKTKLGLAPGERCLNIASLNYDDLRSNGRIQELLTRLEVQKIDIACIQETHNTILETYENHKYCIQFSKAKINHEIKGIQNKGIGGVAIIYRKTLATLITDIRKISNRIMYIALKTNIKCKKKYK